MKSKYKQFDKCIAICLIFFCLIAFNWTACIMDKLAFAEERISANNITPFRNGVTWDTTSELMMDSISEKKIVPTQMGVYSNYLIQNVTISNHQASISFIYRRDQLAMVAYILNITSEEIEALQETMYEKYGEPTISDIQRLIDVSNAVTSNMNSSDTYSQYNVHGWELADKTLIYAIDYNGIYAVYYINEERIFFSQANSDQSEVSAPEKWQIPQVLSLKEMGEILGIEEKKLTYVACDYATKDGSRLGLGYTLGSAEDAAKYTIFVLADPQGGKKRYDLLKSYAFLNRTRPVNGIGDEAVHIGLRNINNDPTLYTTFLVRKGQLVLQVRIPYAIWHGKGKDGYIAYPDQIAQVVADKVLINLFDPNRSLHNTKNIKIKSLVKRIELAPGKSNSPVPAILPMDLNESAGYEYLAQMRQQYLPASVYGNTDLSKSDLNNARRAARLLVESLSKRFDEYGSKPNELEMRASCYRFAYIDTGNKVFRKLAINDYKQAMSAGYMVGKSDYEELATPLLLPWVDMDEGCRDDKVIQLQWWMMEVDPKVDALTLGFYDETMKSFVKQYEEDNGLVPDGVADINFLLSLYSHIDDLDQAWLGE